MNLSIRTKLFLTLLIACTLAVLGMQAFLHWSLRHGLIELAEIRQQEQLNQIGARLVERYREDGDWGRLAADDALWIATLIGQEEGLSRDNPLPELSRHGDEARKHGIWPPTQPLAAGQPGAGQPRPLGMRVMLLDASGKVLYGRPELLKSSVRFPLRLGDERIGELALIPGPTIPERGVLRFRERQTAAFLGIALGMILLSAAFAYPLSKRLSRPVISFRDTTRRLAAGDFRARVPAMGRDELGRLGRDINTLAETLERNEHTRRRWVADISHELRTPLALLRAEVEALQDGVRPLDHTALDSLHGDVLRMSRLVDDLYELSMTDLGALSYRKSETNLVEILEEDLNAHRPKLTAAGLELHFDNRLSGPVTLQADRHRLSQLFRNLLRNSLAYTDRGGSLTVTLSAEGSDLVVDFQDTAPDVPPEALPRLFERLYRVDASRSRNQGGAGLGLAICKNIIEAHGGTILASSSPQGGLWIRIGLPIES